jgi:hypothetical protein
MERMEVVKASSEYVTSRKAFGIEQNKRSTRLMIT